MPLLLILPVCIIVYLFSLLLCHLDCSDISRGRMSHWISTLIVWQMRCLIRVLWLAPHSFIPYKTVVSSALLSVQAELPWSFLPWWCIDAFLEYLTAYWCLPMQHEYTYQDLSSAIAWNICPAYPRLGGGASKLYSWWNQEQMWSLPLTSVYYQGQECVVLYLHSPIIRLHGLVLS
jgi:hypothetical protein